MIAERALEKLGILKHHVTAEEMDAANIRLRDLTASYLTGKIELKEYEAETDKLPGIDLRQLAHDLNYKG